MWAILVIFGQAWVAAMAAITPSADWMFVSRKT